MELDDNVYDVVLKVPPHIARLLSSGARAEFFDLGSARPTLHVASHRLLGHYEDVLGTDIVVRHADGGEADGDGDGDGSMASSIVAMATKRLVFEPEGSGVGRRTTTGGDASARRRSRGT